MISATILYRKEEQNEAAIGIINDLFYSYLFSLDALKFLHLERKILFHGHEPLDTDTTPNLEGEYWLLHNHFCQAEGVTNLDQVPEAGALIAIGFAKPEGGSGEYARYIAICPPDWKYGVSVNESPGAPLPKQPYPLRRDQNGVLKPTKP